MRGEGGKSEGRRREGCGEKQGRVRGEGGKGVGRSREG